MAFAFFGLGPMELLVLGVPLLLAGIVGAIVWVSTRNKSDGDDE